MKNGLCIAAISKRYPEGLFNTFKDSISSIPLSIKVPIYSQIEFFAAMQYYMHQLCIDSKISSQRFLAYRTYTNSTPRDVRIGSSLFNSDSLHLGQNISEMVYVGNAGA